MSVPVRISEAARRVGVSAAALRAWERRYGLGVGRTAANYRLYAPDDLELLGRVKALVDSGVAPSQAVEAVRLKRPGEPDHPALRSVGGSECFECAACLRTGSAEEMARSSCPGSPGGQSVEELRDREVEALRAQVTALEEGGRDRPVVCALVAAFDDRGRVLLGLKATGTLAGTWVVPGGKVERGERLREAAVREFAEECGVRLHPDTLVPAGAFEHLSPETHKICHLFAVEALFAHPRAGSDLKALEWLPLVEALERVRHPPTREMVAAADRAVRGSDHG